MKKALSSTDLFEDFSPSMYGPHALQRRGTALDRRMSGDRESHLDSAWSNAFPPRVVPGRNSKRDHATGSATTIKLPPWAREPVIVIHELTHSMIGHQFGSGFVARHGPRFVRLEIELLSWACGMSKRDLIQSARRYAVKIGPMVHCPRRQARSKGGFAAEGVKFKVRRCRLRELKLVAMKRAA